MGVIPTTNSVPRRSRKKNIGVTGIVDDEVSQSWCAVASLQRYERAHRIALGQLIHLLQHELREPGRDETAFWRVGQSPAHTALAIGIHEVQQPARGRKHAGETLELRPVRARL